MLITFDLVSLQALIVPDKFQHILRVLNTNIDGRHKIMFGLTAIKVSRVRFARPPRGSEQYVPCYMVAVWLDPFQ